MYVAQERHRDVGVGGEGGGGGGARWVAKVFEIPGDSVKFGFGLGNSGYKCFENSREDACKI